MNLIIVLSSSLFFAFVVGAAAGTAVADDHRAGGYSLAGSFFPQAAAAGVSCFAVSSLFWAIYLASWSALLVASGMAGVTLLAYCAFYAVGSGRAAA
jgi:hypothetical protein